MGIIVREMREKKKWNGDKTGKEDLRTNFFFSGKEIQKERTRYKKEAK